MVSGVTSSKFLIKWDALEKSSLRFCSPDRLHVSSYMDSSGIKAGWGGGGRGGWGRGGGGGTSSLVQRLLYSVFCTTDDAFRPNRKKQNSPGCLQPRSRRWNVPQFCLICKEYHRRSIIHGSLHSALLAQRVPTSFSVFELKSSRPNCPSAALCFDLKLSNQQWTERTTNKDISVSAATQFFTLHLAYATAGRQSWVCLVSPAFTDFIRTKARAISRSMFGMLFWWWHSSHLASLARFDVLFSLSGPVLQRKKYTSKPLAVWMAITFFSYFSPPPAA